LSKTLNRIIDHLHQRDFSAAALSKWDHLPVDHHDPEKRISERERRLAEPRAADDPGANEYELTAEQVHNMAFSKPPLFERGYDEDEVDALLDRVKIVLAPQSPGGDGP
jgi:DivIVA domain-containing protein